MNDYTISRRHFIQGLTGAALASQFAPRFVFASGLGQKKLVMIILRGGMDGLSALIPYSDATYKEARGKLAMSPQTDGLLPIDQTFALHPSLKTIHALYQNKQAIFLHAAATPLRSRSHFDVQDVLENGMDKAMATRNGWLNRALSTTSDNHAIAIMPNLPLILQGSFPVQSWTQSTLPDTNQAFYERVAAMYDQDERFHTALIQGMDANNIALANEDAASRKKRSSNAESAAKFLLEPQGPNIAYLDATGWDTHVNQGTSNGALARRLGELDNDINTIKTTLGEEWNNTAILIASEFGRTVRVNGNGGTDHGTAGLAMLLGGAVQGGRVIGEWPTLALNKLYEERDLYPANDIRNLFAGTLQGLYGIDTQTLSSTIFPVPATLRPYTDLIRT